MPLVLCNGTNPSEAKSLARRSREPVASPRIAAGDCPLGAMFGTAINGAVRVDYFWGSGEAAEQQAGRMKQALRVWALWPRAATP